MKAKEIYNLPPISVAKDHYHVEDFMSEVDFWRITNEHIDRIEVRHYANHCFDGERTWSMFSVWYEGKPFMICQEAGRGGRDFKERYVTDIKVYQEAVGYFISFYKENVEDVVDEDSDIPLDFYNCQLSQFYDPDLVLKHKVDDIVMVNVPLDHLRDQQTRVVTRVMIERVNPMNPYFSYHGKQLDRRWSDDGQYMVEDANNGGVWASFAEKDIVA